MTIPTTKSSRVLGRILGIKIHGTSVASVLNYVRFSIAKKTKFTIVTPNPEIVLASDHDPELAAALSNAGLALLDGIGLSAALAFNSMKLPEGDFFRLPVALAHGFWIGLKVLVSPERLTKSYPVVKGRNAFISLCALANKKGWKVFFLGGVNDSARKAADKLLANYKNLKIQTSDGPRLTNQAKPGTDTDKQSLSFQDKETEIEKEVIGQINAFAPQILFIGFGAPKQEKWMVKHLSELNIGGAMVVGGSFDYLAGYAKLPPKWLEKSGLEWLWRLVTQPVRIGRIINAVVVFPLKVFVAKLEGSE